MRRMCREAQGQMSQVGCGFRGGSFTRALALGDRRHNAERWEDSGGSGMRKEQEIFDELARLCAWPGYVHALALSLLPRQHRQLPGRDDCG